jgi:hypothetical protein
MPTHALCWQRDWMQISRRRRSRGRVGPFLGCSVSAVEKTGHGGPWWSCAPWQGQGNGWSLPSPRPEPHPRAEWQQAHRSQPQVRCTGRWSDSSLGPGGRLPQLRATEHTDEVTLGPHPAPSSQLHPHSPGSRSQARATHADPPAHPGASDSGMRPPHVVPAGPGPRSQPAELTMPLGPGYQAPGRLGHGKGYPRLV